MNRHLIIHEEQMQLDEMCKIFNTIKTKLRQNQVSGADIPDELLFLISRINRQETEIWCNIRKMWDADRGSRELLQKDIHDKMECFRRSCARAMTMLP